MDINKSKIAIRAGSERSVRFQFYVDNSPMDLSNIISARLIMRDVTDPNSVTVFDDAGGRIIFEDRTNGIIVFKPDETDFTSGGKYLCYFLLENDSGDKFAIPDDSEFIVEVREKYF